MARIKCPNCGAERVVMEGKSRRCRKCDMRLTAPPASHEPPAEERPDELAGLKAERDALAERVAELEDEVGELNAELNELVKPAGERQQKPQSPKPAEPAGKGKTKTK